MHNQNSPSDRHTFLCSVDWEEQTAGELYGTPSIQFRQWSLRANGVKVTH